MLKLIGVRGLRRGRELLGRSRLAAQALQTYAPASGLHVAEHVVSRAAVPAVDVHNHLGRWLLDGRGWMAPDVEQLVAQLDALQVTSMVNLDGRWGAELEENLERYDRRYPGRFVTFCHVDWSLLAHDGNARRRLVDSLHRSAEAGAGGVKVWKDLGLSVRDDRGQLVLPDDPRIGDVWEAAGELNLPVLIHVADPEAFFRRPDRHNERFEEMARHPDWVWHGKAVPDHRRLLESFRSVLARHPRTTFIGAHVAGWAENLTWVSELLDTHENLFVDVAAREAELGRQPRAAARLITRHADRVLWGTDVFPVDARRYHTWFRLLQTDDEYFPYSVDRVPPQGRWAVSGLALSSEVLEKVYAGNARRVIPALAEPR